MSPSPVPPPPTILFCRCVRRRYLWARYPSTYAAARYVCRKDAWTTSRRSRDHRVDRSPGSRCLVRANREPAFVGRGDELDRLRRRLTDVRDGEARTVLVSGEAGVGKSRLLREFSAIARTAGAHVLHGSCDESLGESVPYVALTEALEGFGSEHGDAAGELGGPSYAMLAGLFDGTGRPAPLSTQHQVFLAVRRMLDRIGERAPAVLILEDLHWADPSTVGLVGALARAQPEGRRVLLVCSHRPIAAMLDTPLWRLLGNADFLRRVEQFLLPVFTKAELRRFMSEVVGGPVLPELVERCFAWSEGIAFHAELLTASHALEEPANALPQEVTGAMMAQLAQISPATRKMLWVAAVAGRRMSHGLLRTVSGLPAAELDEALQESLEQRILVEDRTSGVYAFRHALLREAVYRSRATGSTQELHAQIAESLAADPRLSLGHERTIDAEQAYHWDRAGRWPEALAAAVRAGRAAEQTLAFPSAELQFARALQLWDDVADAEQRTGLSRVRVLTAAANAARWSGHIAKAVEHAQAAIALVDPAVDPDLAGLLHERLANHLWEVGRSAESQLAYDQAARLLEDRPPSAVKARVLAALALRDLRAGHHAAGFGKAEEALAMARAVGARAEEGRALNVSGLALGIGDDPEAGVARLEAAIDIARQVHNLEDLFRAYSNLGLVLEHAGRLDEAADTNRKGLAEARQLDLQDSRQAAVLANNASTALAMLGRWDEAEAVIDETALSRPVGESLYPRLTLAEIQIARGRFMQARDLLDSVAALAQGTNDVRFQGPLHAYQAELALWQDRPAAAIRHVRDGIEHVRGGENAVEQLRLLALGLRAAADQAAADAAEAAASAATGDRLMLLVESAVDAAETAEIEQLVRLYTVERNRIRGEDTAAQWKQVVQGWVDLGRRYPAAYARWREAEAAYRSGDGPGAREAARAAHTTACHLGAEPLRRRVEALAERAGFELATAPEPEIPPFDLTTAEYTVFKMIKQGLEPKVIAQRRNVSVRTVETQLQRIYRKTGVHNRLELIAMADRDGNRGI
ncbi:helix-turn-helix transcriptional regulator [Dactylosporangium sp. CA-139066]|uniref:helix-turn-helix transcriptional regulator n=1 Tax=Dactylosporangium sp. CA-139066 TaxID=3239930 RepID=UPI003D8A898B